MKKYLVLRQISFFSACVDRSFDTLEEASAYKELCEKAETSEYATYCVAEVVG